MDYELDRKIVFEIDKNIKIMCNGQYEVGLVRFILNENTTDYLAYDFVSNTGDTKTFKGETMTGEIIDVLIPKGYDNIVLPKDCTKLFRGISCTKKIDFSNFDWKRVENINSMFYRSDFYEIDIKGKNLDKAKIKDMSHAFEDCEYLTYVDISDMNLESLEKANYAFASSAELSKIYFPEKQLSSLKEISNIFLECEGIDYVDLGCIDSEKLTMKNYEDFENQYMCLESNMFLHGNYNYKYSSKEELFVCIVHMFDDMYGLECNYGKDDYRTKKYPDIHYRIEECNTNKLDIVRSKLQLLGYTGDAIGKHFGVIKGLNEYIIYMNTDNLDKEFDYIGFLKHIYNDLQTMHVKYNKVIDDMMITYVKLRRS